jgi:ubiquinone/menaquinone biosynthesis C-methylase UbiE
MTGYVHGYGTREQQRLIEQAEHWRHGLICEGTRLEPGTRVLEVGCGVGAVLAVLGQEYPGVRLHGIDLEPKQLEFARGYLERSGVEATLVEGEALALPFEDESFDHVWMMWFLEHVPDPPAALREARRILVPGGGVTAIEVDYSTCRAEPSTPEFETLVRAMVQGMAAAGWSDAGTRLPGWLHEAGFREVDEGERRYWFEGEELIHPGQLRGRRARERARRACTTSGGQRGRAASRARRPEWAPREAGRRARMGVPQVDRRSLTGPAPVFARRTDRGFAVARPETRRAVLRRFAI